MPELLSKLAGYQLIPFCPEEAGGLKTPRPPAEIQNSEGAMVLQGKAKVINKVGGDYTLEFIKGAKATLKMVHQYQPDFVILKAKSPSCGVGKIYDGTFGGVLKEGDGVTTALLRSSGVQVYSETDFLGEPISKK